MRYKNLDRFKDIIIGYNNQIVLYYDNDNAVSHNTRNYRGFKGIYKRLVSYSRVKLFDFGHKSFKGIKRFGIMLVKY